MSAEQGDETAINNLNQCLQQLKTESLVDVAFVVKDSFNPLSYASGAIFHFVVDGQYTVDVNTEIGRTKHFKLKLGRHSVVINKITGYTGSVSEVRCNTLYFEVSHDKPISIVAPNISPFSSYIKLKVVSK